MSKTPTRLYTVKHTASGKTRLVEATNPNPALSHVARDEYKVEVADAKEAALLAAAGVRIEVAGVVASNEPPVASMASTTNGAHSASAETVLDSAGEDGRLYDKAKGLVLASRLVSVSLVQSDLQIGFNQASRLIERMQSEGLVSAPDHHGIRTILPDAAA